MQSTIIVHPNGKRAPQGQGPQCNVSPCFCLPITIKPLQSESPALNLVTSSLHRHAPSTRFASPAMEAMEAMLSFQRESGERNWQQQANQEANQNGLQLHRLMWKAMDA